MNASRNRPAGLGSLCIGFSRPRYPGRYALRKTNMKVTFFLLVSLCAMLARACAQDSSQVNNHLLFLSTFDDTTDVNLFGPDNDAGWIYTAESTRRAKVLMDNRCPEVSIAKNDGKIGDCLRFAEKTKDVLFYQASPNLASPRRNWSGTVSFWLKPDLERLGTENCYPIQLSDGDWRYGGFFVRFRGESPSTFEFGAVSGGDAAQAVHCPNGVTEDRRSVAAIESTQFAKDKWTMVTFTFENVNPDGQNTSVAKAYINGVLAGQIRKPLSIRWMDPDDLQAGQNAAVFLGINYIGSVDDLRIYDRALSEPRIQMLYKMAE